MKMRKVPPFENDANLKIAQLGTFDVENYGDLLFPLLAQRRLRPIPGAQVQPVSPAGGPPVWQDAPASIGYDDFATQAQSYRGALVGGGNIIRATASDLATYDKGVTPLLGYSNLWLGVALENSLADVPICWNAPGVPGALPTSLYPLLHEAFERIDYLSVRDKPSRDFLREIVPDAEIAIAPDPAWEIDKLWSPAAIKSAYKKAFALRGDDTPERSIAFHFNSRYLGQNRIEQLAERLDSLCKNLEAKAILVAIGPCHGDDELARRIAGQMKSNPLLIDRPASLKEVAACIARSIAYVGSSMHGFITASSFCVPALVVASPLMVKFPGLLGQIGLPQLVHQSWPDATEHLAALLSEDHAQKLKKIRASQQTGLDRHWTRILETFRPGNEATQGRASIQPKLSYRESVLAAIAKENWTERAQLRQQIDRLNASRREQQEKIERLEGNIREANAYTKKVNTFLIDLRHQVEKEVAAKLDKLKVATEVDGRRVRAIQSYARKSALNSLITGIHGSDSDDKIEERAYRTIRRYYSLVRRRKDAADLASIALSGLFDPEYYQEKNPDVAKTGVDPLIHYVDFGAAEHRNPSAQFDNEYYVANNADAVASGLNPLLHYINVGRAAGRLPRRPYAANAGLAKWTPPATPLPRVERALPKVVPDRVVVYTAVAGGYDDLEPPAFRPPNFEFVVFSDQDIQVDGWRVLPFNYRHQDPTRAARFVKLHPHVYFPNHSHSIWIDANICIRGDVNVFFEKLTDESFFGIFVHPLRDCIYVEGEECIKRKKDDSQIINAQLAQYRAIGFPEHDGLWETNVLLRRHNDPACIALMTDWWREIEVASRRDQLSLPVVAKRRSVKIAPIDTPGANAREHDLLTLVKHPAERRIQPDTQAPPAARKNIDLDSLSITVGVCVHNSPKETSACLNSVAAALRPQDHVVVVDDASDKPTADIVARFAKAHSQAKLIRHEQNRGYTRSANDVFENSTSDWTILLNSDAVVPSNAFRKIVTCGEQYSQIGIVGPLSNAASWQTVPYLTGPDGRFLVNEIPPSLTIEDMDRICEELSTGVVPFVPLVNGFCYGLRRALLAKIGGFDEDNFPMGYGEEDDFSMRAGAAGFLCAIATDTYVYHSKSASFTPERRKPLVEAGQQALRKKHSSDRLAAAVKTMKGNPELVRIRDQIASHLAKLTGEPKRA